MAEPYSKTFICLANSRKTSGRCIAGKEVLHDGFGDWIRPVSARITGELSEEERRFEKGGDPCILDVVEVVMVEHRPHGYQVENHLIDDKHYWRLERRAGWVDVLGCLDEVVVHLWTNNSSSYYGTHDRVSEAEAAGIQSSLKLIKVDDLAVKVAVEGAEFGNGKRKVRACFSLNGEFYRLAITDPIVERQYLARENGTYDVGEAVLCVSLGELYDGYAYKLVAAVFLPSEGSPS